MGRCKQQVPMILLDTWWKVYRQTESIDASSAAAEKLMAHYGSIAKAKEALQRKR